MKYTCLVLDHDDTVVNSTATIHYPCFAEFLAQYRPQMAGKYSLKDYFLKNFDPGYIPFCTDEIGFTPKEMEEEFLFWQQYVKKIVPKAYDGMKEILENHKARGGISAVVSHSLEKNIRRDYEKNGLPAPDAVFGWDYPSEKRKPGVWPLQQIMTQYSLNPRELVVVDDLKPGYDMATAAGVDFIAAGWAYDVPEIETFMRKNVKVYCKSVEELRQNLEY